MDAAVTVDDKATVQTALNEMTSRGVGSSTVVDEGGRLTGTVSQEDMRREVGGRGHDPATVLVSAQVKDGSASCFEDETVDQAEHAMQRAQADELSILNREGVLVGTTDRAAVAENKSGKDLPAPRASHSGFSRVGDEHAIDSTL